MERKRETGREIIDKVIWNLCRGWYGDLSRERVSFTFNLIKFAGFLGREIMIVKHDTYSINCYIILRLPIALRIIIRIEHLTILITITRLHL